MQHIFTNTILAIIIIILTHGVPVTKERLPMRWREQSAVCRPQPRHAWTRSTGDTRAGGSTGTEDNTIAGERDDVRRTGRVTDLELACTRKVPLTLN